MKRVLVTRPEPDNAQTMACVSALGLKPVRLPLMVRENLETSLPPPDGFTAIVFSSANAVRALAERGELSKYTKLPVFAVGEKTGSAARQAGFDLITIAHGNVSTLMTLLDEQNITGSIFYPSAKTIAHDLTATLAPSGILAITTPVYDMRPLAALQPEIIAELRAKKIDAVLFYSRRTAQIFCRLLLNSLDSSQRVALTCICLSENVAAPLLDAKFSRIVLADYPSEEGIMAATLSFARGQITA